MSQNTLKVINTIILIKNITTTIPQSIGLNNRTITEPISMSNVFNNYFTSIAEKTKPNIIFFPKNYIDYLPNITTNAFFLILTVKKDTSFIISSLDSHKPFAPNSIPVKGLKLIKITCSNN